MAGPTELTNEQLSAEAFSKQSAVFDAIYGRDEIIKYKRERVRAHVNQYLKPGCRILELNAGTGEDAIYFAQQGNFIHATDISVGMLATLGAKVVQAGLQENISHERCSFTELDNLKKRGPYDHLFSNFAGLNCTDQLSSVLRSFKPLLKPSGTVTLVVLPPFCLWEMLMIFKGKFKTAFRRINSKNGAMAHVEGVHFRCWYYSPSFIANILKNDYTVLGIEGLCTVVPPSYIENFAARYPWLYSKLVKIENRAKTIWPWRSIGDYYIITLQRNAS